MSWLDTNDLRRAFSALRETDRKRMPDVETLLQRGLRERARRGSGPAEATTRAPCRGEPSGRNGLVARARALLAETGDAASGPLELAESLVQESHRIARNEPTRAREMATLVPRLLSETGRDGVHEPAASDLRVLAAGMEANALRIQGDFRASARVFRRVGHELESGISIARATRAKLIDLESSLCIDRRQFDRAEELIAEGDNLYRQCGDRRDHATSLIKRAVLDGSRHRTEDMLGNLVAAERLLDPEEEPYLHLCAVTARVNALCDLERYAEAQEVFTESLDLYDVEEDRHRLAIGNCLRGRIALGLGELTTAEEAFGQALELALEIGRHYDAALVCLFLAETHLVQGNSDRLREMAMEALEVFRSRDVARDALAAIRLLSVAAQADEVTTSLLSRLRRRIEEAG